MKILVVGASGATGKLLVQQLLLTGQDVKVIVRSREKIHESWKNNKQLFIIEASVLDMNEYELEKHIQDCDAIASCLGHNLSWKGIYGKPRKLVKEAVELLCNVIKLNKPDTPVKFVLMNTAGNRNRDLKEPISMGQKCIIGLIRLLLPPQADNEKAADFLRTKIGQNDKHIQWAAVRPDGLVDEDKVTEYVIYPSPMRSAIFNAGTTSRINVAHFMAELISKKGTWDKWKGQMPVIYNKETPKNN